MSDEDPIRLRDDPAEGQALRAMIEAADGERADEAMLERVLTGVLAGGGGGGAGSLGKAGLAKGSALVAVGGVVAAVVVVIGVVGVGRWRQGPVGESVRTGETSDAGETDGQVETEAFAGETDSATNAAASGANADHAPDHRPLSPGHRVPAPVVDPREDIALVRRATAALESDPARALALADAHLAQFPDSVLAEEREADAILALAALHRDATARAAAFRARWPRSAHLRRIDLALAHP